MKNTRMELTKTRKRIMIEKIIKTKSSCSKILTDLTNLLLD